ncbi:Zinc finger CCCH domain-containing protein 40 [Dichanthelium oligosanthes]|uniref:Zinc finger CCCH domain-containing protein 40 n=1 Tax=Dichanthelium oligosanthes TaxID=888268 RepID=A0A1E5WAE2_9POAL|nr:Zinc finger CCCH domain-containing protein 40 [Dichanthelium oligosanthes]
MSAGSPLSGANPFPPRLRHATLPSHELSTAPFAATAPPTPVDPTSSCDSSCRIRLSSSSRSARSFLSSPSIASLLLPQPPPPAIPPHLDFAHRCRLRAEYDKECKICARPFTVFRWRPGRDARYKKTEICQTCCKLKNVCQVCLLDLEYGLPVQVRDTALAINSNDAIPRSDVNREYFAEEHDRKARAGIDYDSSYGKARPNDTILKLQRTSPYYKRNRAHVCSFYVRGECTRGAECPYRHEMPETGELSQQNIKDRYYGVNDPVAMKLLSKAGEMPSLTPPDDETIRTLYIGGLDSRVTEQDLRDQFYAHGEIESIRMVLQRACAFVTYTTREGAEKAAEELANKLVIKGVRLKLMWGKPQAPKPEDDESGRQGQVSHGGLLPRAVISQQQSGDQPQPPGMEGQQHPPAPASYYFNIPAPPAAERAVYPSMDPQRMGAIVKSQDGEGKPGPQQAGQAQPSSSSAQGGYPAPPPYYHAYYAPPPPYGSYMPPPRMHYPPLYPPYQPMLAPQAHAQASSSQQPAQAGQQPAHGPPAQQQQQPAHGPSLPQQPTQN